MLVNNTPAASPSPLLNTPQPAAAPQTAKPEQGQQDSSVVKLSAQAQQMNRAETQANVDTERAATRPQERTEPPGIQFMAGEDKNGRINTFA